MAVRYPTYDVCIFHLGFPEIQETHDDIYEKLKELRLQDDTGDKIQVFIC